MDLERNVNVLIFCQKTLLSIITYDWLLLVVWYERSMSEGSSEKTRTMSLDLESHKDPRWSRRHPPTRVMLVWLESFEDHLHFPVGQYSLQ